MNPTSIALPYQLREAYLPLLLHLLDEFEQATMVGLVTGNDIRSATEHVVTVLHAPDECIESLTSTSR